MTTLLVQNAEMLVTMDAGRREIAGGGLFARGGVIEQVGPRPSCRPQPIPCSTWPAISCCQG